MNITLSEKSIFFCKQTLLLFFIYFGIRIISFLLNGHLIIQSILSFIILMAFGIIYYKNQTLAWSILLTEIMLGGAGHFLELKGLSIRTLLIVSFAILWLCHRIGNNNYRKELLIQHSSYYIIIAFFVYLTFSAFLGTYYGHSITNVVQDAIPFCLLILLLPANNLFNHEKTQHFLIRLLIVFILGSAIFSLLTFLSYSFDITILHGEYYKWFRDVAMGKITDMQTGFFRIVLPEHLLIAPLALIIGSLLMRDEKHHKMWRLLICACMAIIAVNLSRAYMLGIVAAMPILAYKHKIKEWVKESAFIFLSFLIVFCGISLISTNFKSFGFELLGVRIQSFAKPQIEDSTYTRMALLKPISLMIQAHPILGNGIGSQVIFIDPIIKKMVKTPNFDWGYLEMWAELGIIGTALYVSIIFIILFELIKKIRMVSDWHDFYVGILAASVCLLVINFTAPALFHVCGVLFFVFVSAYILKPLTIFEYTINILYRIFNKGS